MKIYVGNLSRLTNEDTIRQAFEQFGQVASVKIILDRETRESRGFAFVDMPESNEAQKAISDMNGVDLEGRKLTVNEAREPENNGGGSRSSGGNGGGFRSRY